MPKRKPPKSPKSARKPKKSRDFPREAGPARRCDGHRDGRPRVAGGAGGGPVWLYGAHAVLAALANPGRRGHRLLLSPEAERRHGPRIGQIRAAGARLPTADVASREDFGQILPQDAVHQGLAYLAEPLTPPDLAEILADAIGRQTRSIIVVLDQVTDPHNVGAILRSAAAFGAAAVVAPERHAAPDSGALAKAASGALEVVPYLAVVNLARALGQMKEAGFWILGLAGEAERTLEAVDPGGPLALVLGAEGAGLRRLTRESCDLIARLPTRPPIESLNVSTAAAVALYALTRKST